MSHNTTQAICFVAFCTLIAILCLYISPHFAWLILLLGAFKTDRELERRD